jgi:hypothetical protein
MKTAISLPDPLFNATNRLARRIGISRSEVFQRAVQAFLHSHQDEGVTEALDRVYGPRASTSRLDAALRRLQAASLGTEEW